MPQTRAEGTQHWAERRCGEVARRDDARVARRLYHTRVVDGVYRLDAGAWRDACFPFRQARGVMTWREAVQGPSLPRVLVPCVHALVLDGLKTLVGVQRMNALPTLWCRAEACMRLGGCKAPQVRAGSGQRGRTTRPGKRSPGPLCPDTRAHHLGQGNWRDLEARFQGVSRALAKVGGCGQRGTAMADGPDGETTER